MAGSILSIGNFTQGATAANQIIQVPSNLDWLKIYNYTQFAANAGANADELYWQRGMGTIGTFRGIAGGVAVAGITAANAFTLYDPSVETPGAAIAITNINAATGVVLTGTTTGLFVGDTIRLSNLSAASAQQLGGIDFTVSAINPGVSFTIQGYAGSTIPVAPTAAIGACTGFYRKIQRGLFYPRKRVISQITSAASAVVSTTVDHGYSVGMKVRFIVPSVTAIGYGITQLDGVDATITAVGGANSFTINVDTTAMGAFSFPVAAAVPFSPALVVPFGDNTATALAQVPPLSSLEDRVNNTGYLGMILATGANLPAGVANDVVYWQAGKCEFGGL